ncbi:MAG: hypothetical protein VW405_16195 [Rhodospirillaceae bacterium]
MQTVGVDPSLVETSILPPEDWLLVRLDAPLDKTEGGIAIPTAHAPPARTGLVVQAGPGRISEDGKTRLPMSCAVGDRILFEPAAGKGLPRVERETSARGWGYRLMRAGSVCAIVKPDAVTEDEQRALDAGEAELPARPKGGPPVSRAGGRITAKRLLPVGGWIVVKLDQRLTMVPMRTQGGAFAGYLPINPEKLERRPAGKLHRANGAVHLVESEPEEREDSWTGTVLARGEGILTVVRCLDGDRMTRAPKLCEVGDRIVWSGGPPWVLKLNDLDLIEEAEWLVREDTCVVARIAS